MKRNRAGVSRKKQPVNFWESFLFKYSIRSILGLIIITIFLTLVQCSVKSPEAPSWNTQFSIPVINRNYQMDELVDKIGQDELGIDSLDRVSFSYSDSIDAIGIDVSSLATPNLAYTQSKVIGPIDINPPSFTPLSVSLSSISGLATGLAGDSAFIAPIMFSLLNNLPEILEFTSAEISTGSVDITIDNYLGVTLDTILIQLYDRQAGSIVKLDTVIQNITDSSTYIHSLDLSGKTISNYLRVDISASTPGGTVQNFSLRSISTNANFSSTVTVSQAVAQIPAIPDVVISKRIGLSLNPGEKIDSANLNSGNIDMSVRNGTSLNAVVNVSIPSLILDGIPYTINRSISAGEIINITTDLTTYSLIPTDDTVLVNLLISVPGSGTALVPVSATDSFMVSASILDLTFSSITGVIPENKTTFANITQELNALEGFDDISFVSAMISLHIENGVDLPGNLACTLSATNGKTLEILGTIAPRGNSFRQSTTLTNNNVADFLNPIPDSITIGGSISFGDNISHTINANDSVFASFEINAPLHVRINNAEITDIDIEHESLDSADMAKITDHVIEARFVYTITNHLPLGITAIIGIDPDSASLYTTPQLLIDTFYSAAAPVDPITGIAIAEQITEGEIYLDSTDFQILNNDTIFIRPQIILNGSDSAGVLLTGSDYFTIHGRIEVEYLIDSDL